MPITINVKSRRRVEMVDITSSVQKEVSKSGISDGVCMVYVPHTTAAVTINEGADPSVCQDILTKLTDMVPPDARLWHRRHSSVKGVQSACARHFQGR